MHIHNKEVQYTGKIRDFFLEKPSLVTCRNSQDQKNERFIMVESDIFNPFESSTGTYRANQYYHPDT